MAETIVLDPSEVATNRTEYDITAFISSEGVDWGDSAIEAYSADQRAGAMPVDYRVAARPVTIPLVLRDIDTTDFATIRADIQTWAGKVQHQGGWLKRVTSSGGTVYLDVTNASLHLSGSWLQAHRDADIDASLTLEAIPDFYGNEQTLDDHTELSATEIIFTESTGTGGTFPLGDRVRIVVDEDEGQAQRGLMWAFRSRHYDSATTAASAYEAEALGVVEGVAAAKTGASGGTVVTHGTLSTDWSPVLNTNMGGTAYLTHTGTNRVYARVLSASGTAVQARFAWDINDLVNPVTNDAVRLYDGGTFHVLDLGEVRLDPVPTGAHRWIGQIQAVGDAGGESFSVDRVWIVNQDESSGLLSAPAEAVSGVALAGYLAKDNFAQTAGTLNGKTALLGGNWTTAGVAGTANWNTTGSTSYYARRVAVSDADINTGGYAVIGSAIGASAAQVDTRFTAVDASSSSVARYGVLLRYTDTSNWLMFALETAASNLGYLSLYKRTTAAGVVTLAQSPATPYGGAINAWYRLRAVIDAMGNYGCYLWINGGPVGLILSGSHPDLTASGTLATGKVGFYNAQTSATANTRDFDNFLAWAPAADAVMYASRSLELGTQGILRQDTGGTAYGPVSNIVGDLPRMPNLSSGGTVEFFAKASRGDLTTMSDPAIDNISARIYRRPSYLYLP